MCSKEDISGVVEGEMISLKNTNSAHNVLASISEHSEKAWLLLLWLIILSERIAFTIWDKTGQSFIVIDSQFYYQSGLDLVRTGRLIYRGCPTALIMPGTSVLIGILSLFFQDGPDLMYATRILWFLMGSLVPLITYSALRLYTGHWAAFFGAAVYLLPWHVQIDCFLLTECPYYLFFALALFYTLKMGESKERKYIWCWSFSILAGLMFRPNILIFVLFSFAYLVLNHYSLQDIIKRAGILTIVLALFIIPWTIRNWQLYHAFIPVTYGANSPLLEGSYQGVDVPSDDELGTFGRNFDVYSVVSDKRPDLIDKEGHVYDPEMQQYADMLVAGELAHFRLNAWRKLRPLSFLKSYLYVKPRLILNWVWYYMELGGISFDTAHRMRQLGLLFCMLSVGLSLKRKRYVKQTAFLAISYIINVFILASSYVIDRYAQMIMPYRYLLGGIGLQLILETFEKERRKKGIHKGEISEVDC